MSKTFAILTSNAQLPPSCKQFLKRKDFVEVEFGLNPVAKRIAYFEI
jgi:hypothetical protein